MDFSIQTELFNQIIYNNTNIKLISKEYTNKCKNVDYEIVKAETSTMS